MAITSEQRAERRKHIQSSDLPKIVGASPWGGPSDVFFEKAYPIEKEPEETDSMRLGNRFESPILEEVAYRLELGSIRISPDTFYADDGINGSNIDAIIPDNPNVHLEAKLVCPERWVREIIDSWGEHGTDQVPDYVNIQVQHQMAVYGSRTCYVGAFIPGRGIQIYKVEYHQELGEMLLAEGRRFWNEHVVPRVPPEGIPSFESVKYIKRIERKSVDLPHGWVPGFWNQAREVRLLLAKLEDIAKAQVVAALGDAEEGRVSGGGLVTFHADKRGYRSLRWKVGDPV